MTFQTLFQTALNGWTEPAAKGPIILMSVGLCQAREDHYEAKTLDDKLVRQIEEHLDERARQYLRNTTLRPMGPSQWMTLEARRGENVTLFVLAGDTAKALRQKK